MSNYEDKAEVTREFYRRQGEVRERERIIKLLEVELTKEEKSKSQRYWVLNGLPHAIALIKGENK